MKSQAAVYKVLFFLLITLSIFIGGCTKKVDLPCPKAMVLSEASSITTFISSKGKDITDIETETIIDRVVRSCNYKKSIVSVNTNIKIESTKGPNYKSSEKNLKIFVAVLDKDEKIVGKEIFNINILFPPNSKKSQLLENIEQIIPIRPGLRGIDYTVLVGFSLDPLDLLYNRKQRQIGKIKRLP